MKLDNRRLLDSILRAQAKLGSIEIVARTKLESDSRINAMFRNDSNALWSSSIWNSKQYPIHTSDNSFFKITYSAIQATL